MKDRTKRYRTLFLFAIYFASVMPACPVEDCLSMSTEDMDNDGYPADEDCNDNNATVYPGAEEVPYNGVDEDCSGEDLSDQDQDGYAGGAEGADCDDQDPLTYPGADEICDGKSNGCTGHVDDWDGDGYVAEACGGDDCDDTSAEVNPGETEIPYDGKDQDCFEGDLVDVDNDGHDSVLVGGDDCDDNDGDFENPALVFIPAGVFRMGSDAGDMDESPMHGVYLSAYCIARYEVTNKEYMDYCESSDDCKEPASKAVEGVDDYYGEQEYWNYPVVHVTWDQAQAYCESQGFSLPTEAQWEKAARGGECLTGEPDEGGSCESSNPNETRQYPWGDDEPTCELANFDDYDGAGQCVGMPVSVETLERGISPYGLYNLSGNVAEWTYDYYAANYYDQTSADGAVPVDPVNEESGEGKKVYRGGSYFSLASEIRVTKREGTFAISEAGTLGFRCAWPFSSGAPGAGE